MTTQTINRNAATIALVFTLLGNVVALVWGASTISHTVERLQTWADKTAQTVAEHETRITVLEDHDKHGKR